MPFTGVRAWVAMVRRRRIERDRIFFIVLVFNEDDGDGEKQYEEND